MHKALLDQLDLQPDAAPGASVDCVSPIDGHLLGRLPLATDAGVDAAIGRSAAAFAHWREVPAPVRGELVRQFGNVLRERKQALAELISVECGKIVSEGLGEVQEMIDICDFAVGLSRQLYGLTIASERPQHVLRETWHPLGPVGVITAFNFPMAVWSWNAAIAWVCGDPVVWKPSEKASLCAMACRQAFAEACARFGDVPMGLLEVVTGEREAGRRLVDDPRLKLISATGSCAMGRVVGQRVAARVGRCLLELGGNNAAVVAPSADIELAARAIAFGAAGTAGQRCTTTRRLFAHADVYEALMQRLQTIYRDLPVGNPLQPGTLVGPLIDGAAFDAMQEALTIAAAAGCRVSGGERVEVAGCENGFYARPALVEGGVHLHNHEDEVFAPVLYCFEYRDFDDMIERHNAVPQGLSSSIFTRDLGEAERFMSVSGSDCGFANVNVGTSGAEIGGAFGGEKATGGGREAGSDAWKAYMRRSTSTVNYGNELPLAQGVRFDIGDPD